MSDPKEIKPHPDNSWAIYTSDILDRYDELVLTESNNNAWLCSAEKLIETYKKNVGKRHLDVGVGTGFFLQKENVPAHVERIDLLDLNSDCLLRAGKVVRYVKSEAFERDLRDDFELNDKRMYDSISINYLLHCIPCSMAEKLKIINRLWSFLAEGGIIFGSTIFGKEVKINSEAAELLKKYNELKIFTNLEDGPVEFSSYLKANYQDHIFHLEGCVGIFECRK